MWGRVFRGDIFNLILVEEGKNFFKNKILGKREEGKICEKEGDIRKYFEIWIWFFIFRVKYIGNEVEIVIIYWIVRFGLYI